MKSKDLENAQEEIMKSVRKKEERKLIIQNMMNNQMAAKMMKEADQRIQKGLEKSKLRRVIGRDDGRSMNRKLSRNKPCLCGSNLKAKKCCVTLDVALEKLQEQEGDIDV